MRRNLVLYWGPPLALAALIFIFSSIPGTHLEIELFPHADKLAHAGEFGALALRLLRALGRTTNWRPWITTGATVALVLAYGALDELHQSFVPLRDVDAWDVVADLAGGVIGCGVWCVVRQLCSTRRIR